MFLIEKIKDLFQFFFLILNIYVYIFGFFSSVDSLASFKSSPLKRAFTVYYTTPERPRWRPFGVVAARNYLHIVFMAFVSGNVINPSLWAESLPKREQGQFVMWHSLAQIMTFLKYELHFFLRFLLN